MKRLACLLSLGAALVAAPVLGAVTGAAPTVAVVSPPLSKVTTSGGCTPINPCAVVTPALDNAPLPAPENSAQPDLPADTPSVAGAAAPAPPRTANATCPPARGGQRRSFAGRSGDGQAGAEGLHRLAQAGARAGVAGRGAGGRGRFARGADGCPKPRPSSSAQ